MHGELSAKNNLHRIDLIAPEGCVISHNAWIMSGLQITCSNVASFPYKAGTFHASSFYVSSPPSSAWGFCGKFGVYVVNREENTEMDGIRCEDELSVRKQ